MKFMVKKLTCFKASAVMVLLLSILLLVHAADTDRLIRVTNVDNDTESFLLPEQVIQLSETFRSILDAVEDQDKVSLPDQFYQTMNELHDTLFIQPALVALETNPTAENAQNVKRLLRSLNLEKKIALLYLANHLNMPNLLAVATDMVAQSMIDPGILHNILPHQQPWQQFMEKEYATLYENPDLNNLVAQVLLRNLTAWQNLWGWREIGHVDPIADQIWPRVAISGDGQRIAIGYVYSGRMRIVDDLGNPVGQEANPAACRRMSWVAISDNGQRIVIGYSNGLVRIVDGLGTLVRDIDYPADEDWPMFAISGNGQRIVIGYRNGIVRIVDGDGNLVRDIAPAADERGPMVAISGNGQRIIIGYYDGLVRIADGDGNLVRDIDHAAGEAYPQVVISENGQRMVIGYGNGRVRIVDGDGNLVRDIDHAAYEKSARVAISGDGQRIVVGYANGLVRILNGAETQVSQVVPAAGEIYPRVAISGSGQCIVIGYRNGQVRIVDGNGNLVRDIGHAAYEKNPHVVISGNGQCIVIGYEVEGGRIHIFKQQQPSLSEITLQQAQLIVAILQRIITIGAMPAHLVPVFNDIPQEIRDQLAQQH